MSIEASPHPRLSKYTTFRLGGECKRLLDCRTEQDVVLAVRDLRAAKEDFILIGGGSNLLVSDQGVPCCLIRYHCENSDIQVDGNRVRVSGGTILDHLAKFAVENGLSGLNCTAWIPGTVGGAIAGNAGAYGKQISDFLETVTVLNRKNEIQTLSRSEMEFSYRDSNFKASGDIILSAEFQLCQADRAALLAEREEMMISRRQKHPDVRNVPCAGSFFRNVEPSSNSSRRQAAGWFLEQAGAKQMTCGGAAVFEKHANMIIKALPDCTAQDVFTLACQMQQAVHDQFQIQLIREVRLIGPFAGLSSSEIIN